MTEKLYDRDSHLRQFSARVAACEPVEGGFAVVLDRTAFFPEGGGQAADTGSIGRARVRDVQEKAGKILHYTDLPLAVGETVDCLLDWEQRFARMQGHSGEHVVSGLVHARFGYDNVGFHLGDEEITLDFNGELTARELREIELAANRVVWENVPVTVSFPPPEELAGLSYRSKLELTENVRIVTIEGYDCCACCAPHVSRTGEIGMIKLVDCMRHRGGVRITMLAGELALADYAEKQETAAALSALLSARRNTLVPAVERLLAERDAARYENTGLRRRLLLARLEAAAPSGENLCFVEEPGYDDDSLRTLVNEAVKRCQGIAAAFSGDDENGYRYVIGSQSLDLRVKAKELNGTLNGRGGGRPEMIQGSVKASREAIEAFFARQA